MSWNRRSVQLFVSVLALLALSAVPAVAQGKGKAKPPETPKTGGSGVSVEVALSATREVLIQQGFEVVRVETEGERHVVYYRAGNRGRGRGQGPPVRLVIQRVGDRIVLEEAPDALKVEIGVKLGIRL
jgi:hypothetical protein